MRSKLRRLEEQYRRKSFEEGEVSNACMDVYLLLNWSTDTAQARRKLKDGIQNAEKQEKEAQECYKSMWSRIVQVYQEALKQLEPSTKSSSIKKR